MTGLGRISDGPGNTHPWSPAQTCISCILRALRDGEEILRSNVGPYSDSVDPWFLLAIPGLMWFLCVSLLRDIDLVNSVAEGGCCKSVSAALLLTKLTAGAPERQQ